MNKHKPVLISFIAFSDSGKTTLIRKLLPILAAKGLRVAVAKHCPRGFDLDIEGKDSWYFTKAGSKGIFLSAPGSVAIMRPDQKDYSLKAMLEDYFSDFDIVLMEGYSTEPAIKKIQIIRKGIGGEPIVSDELVAYITDTDLISDKPVFGLNDIERIVTYLEDFTERKLRGGMI